MTAPIRSRRDLHRRRERSAREPRSSATTPRSASSSTAAASTSTRSRDKVAAFGVAVPSWGVGTGGTRFARFPGAGEPRNIFDKLEDCAVIQQLTARHADRLAAHPLGQGRRPDARCKQAAARSASASTR